MGQVKKKSKECWKKRKKKLIVSLKNRERMDGVNKSENFKC